MKRILSILLTLALLPSCESISPELRASLERSAAAAIDAGTARVIQEIGPKAQKVRAGK